MRTLFKGALIFIMLSIFFVSVLNPLSFLKPDRAYLKQLFYPSRYTFWTRFKFTNPCENTTSYKNALIQNLGSENKANIIYLDSDLSSCPELINEVVLITNELNMQIAVQIVDIQDFKDKNISDVEVFVEKIHKLSSLKEYLAYVVIERAYDYMTIEERRGLIVKLREEFTNSFITMVYDPKLGPTPDNKHPLRDEISWDEFKLNDNEGDLLITKTLQSNVRRVPQVSIDKTTQIQGFTGEFLTY